MIDKREIIDTATALGLTPHVVEKDDVLGWLLWGIRNHRAVGNRWAFKGGNHIPCPRPGPLGSTTSSGVASARH